MARIGQQVGGGLVERRSSRRFSIQLPLWGWVVGNRKLITGETINIGSVGVLFAAQEPIPIGAKLELHIDWPVGSPKGEQMELAGLAFVVRTTNFLVAARFWQCSLRTKSSMENGSFHSGRN